MSCRATLTCLESSWSSTLMPSKDSTNTLTLQKRSSFTPCVLLTALLQSPYNVICVANAKVMLATWHNKGGVSSSSCVLLMLLKKGLKTHLFNQENRFWPETHTGFDFHSLCTAYLSPQPLPNLISSHHSKPRKKDLLHSDVSSWGLLAQFPVNSSV